MCEIFLLVEKLRLVYQNAEKLLLDHNIKTRKLQILFPGVSQTSNWQDSLAVLPRQSASSSVSFSVLFQIFSTKKRTKKRNTGTCVGFALVNIACWKTFKANLLQLIDHVLSVVGCEIEIKSTRSWKIMLEICISKTKIKWSGQVLCHALAVAYKLRLSSQ